MAAALEHSYRYCRKVARARARNFYYGFWLLPKPRRDAFCAVYAFMRHCDDVADGDFSPAEKAARLRQRHEALDRALAGDTGGDLGLPALRDAVQRYQIPPEYLHELIAGTEMDLSHRTYETFEELRQYCYRVASVVGLCSLHMFGFRDPQAKPLAERCGIAFQLTNILRDLREDAAAGRIYLPLEDLRRFGYSPQELSRGIRNQAFRDLMRFEIARARDYYRQAEPLIEMVESESRPALWALISIYRSVLRAVEQEVERGSERPKGRGENGGAAVWDHRPASLSAIAKWRLVMRATRMRLELGAGGRPDWHFPA